MVYTLVLEASAERIESSSLSRRTTIWGMGLLGVDTCFASRTQIGSNPIFSTNFRNIMKTRKPRNHVHLALLKRNGAGSHKKSHKQLRGKLNREGWGG